VSGVRTPASRRPGRRRRGPRHLGPVRRALRPRGPQPKLGRTVVFLQLLLALAVVGYLLQQQGVKPPLLDDDVTIRAEFSDASGLAGEDHSPVSIAGVPAGEVSDVDYEDGVAVATLKLDAGMAERIRSDAEVRIVPRSALQDLMVDIDPGSSGNEPLAEGATISAADTSTTVGTDRVVGILDADTRAYAQVLLSELGTALDGRGGELADGMQRLDRLTDAALPIVRTLDERRKLLTGLVDSLDTVFGRLDDRSAQLANGIELGRRTLEVTAGRDSELAELTRQLPGTLATTRTALDRFEGLAGPLRPTLTELLPVAERLPGALSALREFTPQGERLLAAVQDLADRGAPGIASARGALSQLGPLAAGLQQPVADAGTVVDAIDRNKDGIGVLGDRFSGVFSTNDSNGTILRGLGFFEQPDPRNLGFPDTAAGRTQATAAAAKALTRVCVSENQLACLVRYLVPDLPDVDLSAVKVP